MRVASWNMHRYNQKGLQGAEKLVAAGHDVICLQEVPEKILEKVLNLAPHHAQCRELVWQKGAQKTFLVTLSQHPMSRHIITPHKRWPNLLTKLAGLEEGLEFLASDIHAYNRNWRIFNVHLPLHAPPFGRMIEWIRIYKKFDKQSHNIVCADFNAFAGSIWSALLSPLVGTKLKHLMAHERWQLRKFLEKKQLENPFAKWRTQSQLPYQLDFILHGKELQVVMAERWPDRLNSDHWPLSLTLENISKT